MFIVKDFLFFVFVFLGADFTLWIFLQVELMKKKLPWLKYDMKKADYMESKRQEADAKRKFDEAAKMLNDLKVPIEYVLLASCN